MGINTSPVRRTTDEDLLVVDSHRPYDSVWTEVLCPLKRLSTETELLRDYRNDIRQILEGGFERREGGRESSLNVVPHYREGRKGEKIGDGRGRGKNRVSTKGIILGDITGRTEPQT